MKIVVVVFSLTGLLTRLVFNRLTYCVLFALF